MNKQLDDIEEPTDDELDEMMVEDSDNVIKFPGQMVKPYINLFSNPT